RLQLWDARCGTAGHGSLAHIPGRGRRCHIRRHAARTGAPIGTLRDWHAGRPCGGHKAVAKHGGASAEPVGDTTDRGRAGGGVAGNPLCRQTAKMRSDLTRSQAKSNPKLTWALLDSNQRPADYESAALTG